METAGRHPVNTDNLHELQTTLSFSRQLEATQAMSQSEGEPK